MILSKIPIKISAPLLLTLPVIIVAATLSAIAFTHARNAADTLIADTLTQIHDQIHGHVHELLFAPSRINRINHSLLKQNHITATDVNTWKDSLIAQAQAFPMLSTIAFGGVDGQSTWICRYAGDPNHTYYAILGPDDGKNMKEYRVDAAGSMTDQPTASFSFDPRVRPWYQAPVKVNQSAWCQPFVWVGGEDADAITVGISYGELFQDAEGKLLGVIDADLSLQDISNFLQQLKIGKTGRAFIIDNQAMLIATSSNAAIATAEGKRLFATQSEQPAIAAAAQFITTLSGDLLLKKPIRQTVTIDREKHLLMAAPLSHPTGLNWTIITVIPESDFTAEIKAGRTRSLLFSILAVGLTLLAGVIAALLMVQPMVKLTGHARLIAQGNLDKEIHLTWSPELKLLSEEINEMTAGLKDRMRLRKSLQLAMEVQQSLLPDSTPQVSGLDICGHSNYCDETGGDYYDYLQVTGIDEKSIAVALGDVMGHGIAAAMLMATARGILRSRAQDAGSLAELLTHMNELLVDVTRGLRFMTMLLLTIDSHTRTLRFASAGHDPPFFYNHQSQSFIELNDDDGGVPLGIMHGERYTENTLADIPCGSIVVVATDGVWEAQNVDDQMYGKQRLCQVIADHCEQSAANISLAIRNDLQQFIGESQQLDDITFVVVKFD